MLEYLLSAKKGYYHVNTKQVCTYPVLWDVSNFIVRRPSAIQLYTVIEEGLDVTYWMPILPPEDEG